MNALSEALEVALPSVVALWRKWRKKPVPVAPRCILVVEDHPTNAKLLGLQLDALGYQHKTAGSAESALDMAREEKPEFYAAFIDLNLPGHDGYWLAEQLTTDSAHHRDGPDGFSCHARERNPRRDEADQLRLDPARSQRRPMNPCNDCLNTAG